VQISQFAIEHVAGVEVVWRGTGSQPLVIEETMKLTAHAVQIDGEVGHERQLGSEQTVVVAGVVEVVGVVGVVVGGGPRLRLHTPVEVDKIKPNLQASQIVGETGH
jgi:hypothetical protein